MDLINMTVFYTFIVLCLSGNALAQSHSFGSCPQVEVQSNFNPSKFYGRWYERERYFAYYELNSKCNTFDFYRSKTATFSMVSSFVSSTSEEPQTFKIDVFTPNRNQPAKMLLQIPLSPVRGYNNLSILGTDYVNYAVIYSCNDKAFINVKYAWILTRKRNPDKSVIAKIYEVIDKSGVNKSYFWKADHDSCRKNHYAL